MDGTPVWCSAANCPDRRSCFNTLSLSFLWHDYRAIEIPLKVNSSISLSLSLFFIIFLHEPFISSFLNSAASSRAIMGSKTAKKRVYLNFFDMACAANQMSPGQWAYELPVIFSKAH